MRNNKIPANDARRPFIVLIFAFIIRRLYSKLAWWPSPSIHSSWASLSFLSKDLCRQSTLGIILQSSSHTIIIICYSLLPSVPDFWPICPRAEVNFIQHRPPLPPWPSSVALYYSAVNQSISGESNGGRELQWSKCNDVENSRIFATGGWRKNNRKSKWNRVAEN